jgi:hypothetical protein
MKKSVLIVSIAAAASLAQAPAHAFLDKLKGGLEKLQQGGAGSPPRAAATGSGSAAPPGRQAAGRSDFAFFCRDLMGVPFKEKKLNTSPEAMVGNYLRVDPDIEVRLNRGIHQSHQGSFVNLRVHTPDLHDKTVRDLAEAFVANPSVPMFAQVIAYAAEGDGYRDGEKPSERTEAQTLLAMLLLQYPDLVKDKDAASRLLRQSSMDNSGLGTALIARAHLFGDLAPRNINTFSNYIARASAQYNVKLADQTIYYALNNITNWRYRQQYLDLIKQSQEMSSGFERQRVAARSTDVNRRALALLQESQRIDELTLDALGAGPKLAEIRAKAEMLKKEGSGEANLIEVATNQSQAFKEELNLLLAKSPQLDEGAKAKLAEAMRLRLANINVAKGLVVEVALKFLSGDIGATQESGEHMNRFMKSNCSVFGQEIVLAKQSGVPEPQLSNAVLAKDL